MVFSGGFLRKKLTLLVNLTKAMFDYVVYWFDEV